jgi:acyl transferase domain-containing protein
MTEVHYAERTGFEIAIIGMGGRFPGAKNVREYWRNLCAGKETLTHFSSEELAELGASEAVRNDPSFVRVSPRIGEIDQFDAAFFNFSPREAEIIDPQSRVLLESAWEALEDAGYTPDAGLVGCWAGSRISLYMLQVYRNPEVMRSMGDFQVQIGSDKDYLATRIAYKLNLGGPAVTVQTACSTALVAVHSACQSLIAGEIDLALAGGVAISVPEPYGYPFKEGEVYSKTGRVRPFDAGADGTVFGNGSGMVVLKRLEDAERDRDHIYAVIKGSAVTNDGARKVGFTAPGADGQRRVVRAAQLAADVDPDTITYIEAHGTGTNLGDPIEVDALTKAFRESTDRRGFCRLGSVKGNVGHLSSAAGVAGLIKLSLALENKVIPASLWYDTPNPQIDFAASPFVVNTELSAWETPEGLSRRAGLSAFGIGGTNGHVICEEAPPPPPSGPSRPWQLVPLSARTSTALDTMTANLAGFLAEESDLALADAAFTLARGRKVFEHRRVALVRDPADAQAVLGGEVPARLLSGTPESQDRPVTFLFTGQGSQYAGMGHGLYRSEPVFRAEVDRAAELLQPHLGRDLRELLFPPAEGLAAAQAELEQTALTQPALFVVEYALAKLWQSWGIAPKAMLGHSIGEYVAATLAGVFEIEDALRLVAARGRLMQAQPPGDMLAVPMAEAELLPLLGPTLSIAALNAPSRSVVSGPSDDVQAFAASLAERGVACRPLHTSHAFHSGMMESMLGPFLAVFEGVRLAPPAIPFVSNLTGTWITAEQATDPGYWAHHLRGAVRFSDGIELLGREVHGLLLEVGPGNTLTSLARQNPGKGEGTLVLGSMRHPKDAFDDQAFLLESLGRMWLAGVPVDWVGFFASEDRRRVSLPPYPFEKRSYMVAPATGNLLDAGADDPGKKLDLPDWFSVPYWKPSVVPAGTPEEAAAAAEGGWLLFDDGSSLGHTLGDWLAANDRRVAWVAPGAAFEKSAPGRYVVGPDPEDYRRVLVDLDNQGFAPRQLVHLWNVGERPADGQDRAFYGLLALAQGIGKRGGSHEVRLAVVTSGVERVRGEAVPHPERATVLGPVQVMPAEYPTVRAAALDVDLPAAGGPEEAELALALAAELAAGLPDPWVAYREGERYLRDLQPIHLGEVDPAALRIREGGTYVVTGGLGGFGLTFAEWLCRDHRANVVLLGRRALPPREEWADWIESRPEDRTARRLTKVLAIEALGGQVAVEAANVADVDSLRAAFLRTRARFGEIHGVIHAAGVPGGGLMQLKTREMAASVLEPKIAGTLALEKALEGTELDFLVLCSSTIAVLGGLGQVDYSAANNFLDAFARSRAGRRGAPYVVSLDWSAWREVGMAVETPLPAGAAQALAGTVPASTPAEAPFEGPGLHPLLDRLIEDTPERKVFSTQVGPDRHWVLDEHRIGGTPALPGTTYLEIVRAAFGVITGEDAPFEVSSLYFMTPVLVELGTRRELQLHFDMKTGGGASFRFVSTGPDGEPKEHARGEVARVQGERPADLDLGALAARCTKDDQELSGDEVARAEKLVFWGERWHSLRRIRIGEDEGLATLILPERFVGDLEQYPLHPALIDVATAIGGTLVAEGSYLPLAYRRVRAYGALLPTVVSHIRVHRTAGKETIGLDVTLCSPEGRVLVDVEGFTMKRVGAALVAPKAASAPAPVAPPSEAPRTMFGADGMAPAEGVEALRRVLARGRHAQIGIAPRDLRKMLAQVRAATARRAESEATGSAGAASGASHPRPNLATAYVAPRNELEARLATVWAATLGIDRVGVHDNFFELGGDSILGIQVIARAAKASITLAPEQLFEHQTVAELAAAVADTVGGAFAAEALPVGPHQAELLSGAGATLFLTLDPSGVGEIDGALARTALTEVARRHPALALRFEAGDDGWTQIPGDDPVPLVLDLDLGSRPLSERTPALAEIRSELAAGLAAGPQVGVAVVRGADAGEDRLILAVARPAADEASLARLAADLERAYHQLAAGGVVEIESEGAAFSRWVERLPKRASELAGDLDHWLDVRRTQVGFLPAGGTGSGIAPTGIATVRHEVPADTALLAEIGERFRVEPGELLLTAVADALARTTGEGSFLIRVEADGRSLFPDLDEARTVGCFTLPFPHLVELGPAGANAGELLREVKEGRRGVPSGGASFALLAAHGADPGVTERLRAMPRPQVGLVEPSAGERVPRALPEGVDLEIGLTIGKGGSWLVASYDQGALAARTVEELLTLAAEALQELGELARRGEEVSFSPADFPEAGLSQGELDQVFSKLKGTVE